MGVTRVGASPTATSDELRRERTSCRCCTANCGVVVTIDGTQALKLEGDHDHPISRGYTCVKGRAVPARHHDPRRLSVPVMRGEVVDWEKCLADVSDTIRRLVDTGGPDSIGFYAGTGGYWDTLGWWSLFRFFAAIGSRQRYTAATVDVAPVLRAAQLVTGYHLLQPSWIPDDPAGAGIVLIFGSNPLDSHGYLGSSWPNPVQRLREYRSRGGEIWVFDPRRTRTAAAADSHVRPRPGSDLFLLAWLVRELLIDGADEKELARACNPEDVARLRVAVARFDRAYVEAATGVDAATLTRLLASIRNHKRIAALTGSGISFGPHGVVAEWMRWALLIVTGSLDRRDGMFFNPPGLSAFPTTAWPDRAPPEGHHAPGPASRPDLHGFFGERPSAAIADEIEAGKLRTLFVFGGNPLTALPQPDRLRAALAKLDMLVLVDVFDNELAQFATHVLPSTWMLERGDIRPMPDRIQYAPALLPAGGGRKPGWWIFAALAERLGHDLVGCGIAADALDERSVFRAFAGEGRTAIDDVLAGASHGAPTERRYGWVRETILDGGRWRLAPGTLVERLAAITPFDPGPRLVPGRILNVTNSVGFAPHRDGSTTAPGIHVSVDIAERERLEDGDAVVVETAAGSVGGALRIDRNLAPDTIWLTHGWGDLNVNHLIDSRAIDNVTTQPILSAIAVKIRRRARP